MEIDKKDRQNDIKKTRKKVKSDRKGKDSQTTSLKQRSDFEILKCERKEIDRFIDRNIETEVKLRNFRKYDRKKIDRLLKRKI